MWRWLNDKGDWSPYFYINLESPWIPTPLGFDTRDWVLDVIVHPDFRTEYKDNDELRWCVEVGTQSAEQERRICAAGGCGRRGGADACRRLRNGLESMASRS